jgi:hypothetical protein
MLLHKREELNEMKSLVIIVPAIDLAAFAPKFQNDRPYILGGLCCVSILLALCTLAYTKASEDFVFIDYALI